jgi:hypothetical protein
MHVIPVEAQGSRRAAALKTWGLPHAAFPRRKQNMFMKLMVKPCYQVARAEKIRLFRNTLSHNEPRFQDVHADLMYHNRRCNGEPEVNITRAYDDKQPFTW